MSSETPAQTKTKEGHTRYEHSSGAFVQIDKDTNAKLTVSSITVEPTPPEATAAPAPEATTELTAAAEESSSDTPTETGGKKDKKNKKKTTSSEEVPFP